MTKWTYVAIAFLLVPALGPSPLPQSSSSAFDECRIVTASDLRDKQAPRFANHRVEIHSSNKLKLDLKSNPIARRFRNVLRQEVARGPNFAGDYRVAAWGCGSSCTMFAVVNLSTGRVITPSEFSSTSGVYFGVEDGQELFPDSESEFWLLAFRKDSRLLVVLGALDEDESREGAFYLVLDKDRLQLVHKTIVQKDCENLRSNSARQE
jgi:hypothetical protein